MTSAPVTTLDAQGVPTHIRNPDARRAIKKRRNVRIEAIRKVRENDDPDFIDRTIAEEKLKRDREGAFEMRNKVAIARIGRTIVSSSSVYTGKAKPRPEGQPKYSEPYFAEKLKQYHKRQGAEDDEDDEDDEDEGGGKGVKKKQGKGRVHRQIVNYTLDRERLEKDLSRPTIAAERARRDPQNMLDDPILLDFTLNENEQRRDRTTLESTMEDVANIADGRVMKPPKTLDRATRLTHKRSAPSSTTGNVSMFMEMMKKKNKIAGSIEEQKQKALVAAFGPGVLYEETQDPAAVQQGSKKRQKIGQTFDYNPTGAKANLDAQNARAESNMFEMLYKAIQFNGKNHLSPELLQSLEQYTGPDVTLTDLAQSENGKSRILKILRQALVSTAVRSIGVANDAAERVKVREEIEIDLKDNRSALESARNLGVAGTDDRIKLGKRKDRDDDEEDDEVRNENQSFIAERIDKVVGNFVTLLSAKTVEAGEAAKRLEEAGESGFQHDPMTETMRQMMSTLSGDVNTEDPAPEFVNIDLRRVYGDLQFNSATVNGRTGAITLPVMQSKVNEYWKQKEQEKQFVWNVHPAYEKFSTSASTMPVVTRNWMEYLMTKPNENDQTAVLCCNGHNCVGYNNALETTKEKFVPHAFYFEDQNFPRQLEHMLERQKKMRDTPGRKSKWSQETFENVERTLTSFKLSPQTAKATRNLRRLVLKLVRNQCILCILRDITRRFYRGDQEVTEPIHKFKNECGPLGFKPDALLMPPHEETYFRGIVAPVWEFNIYRLSLVTDQHPETGVRITRYKFNDSNFR